MTKAALFIPVLALMLAAPIAQAAPASAKIAATFGNTIVSTYSDGRSQKVWLKDDGSWTGLSRRGNPLAGKWTAKGDKVCLKQTSPAIPFFSFCQELPNDPAKGMDSNDLTGRKIHLKLVKGHVTKSEG